MAVKRKNYPGMFDLVKGYAMIGIIFHHSFGTVPYERMLAVNSTLATVLDTGGFLLSFGYAILPLLFIISGYGFSVTSMKKCIKKQSKTLLKPYLLTGCCVVILYFFSRYLLYGDLQDTLVRAWGVILGYLLGITSDTVINGFKLYFVGSVWFLLTLYLSWMIFNSILLYSPKRWQPFAISAIVCLGYLMGQNTIIPLCLPRSFVAVGYMYAGYVIKQKDLLYKQLPPAVWFMIILSSLITLVFSVIGMPSAELMFGLIDIVGAGCYAFLLAKLTLFLNQYDNPLIDKLRAIGRYSFWIMCAHTIESRGIGLLWGALADQIVNPFVAFASVFFLRCCFIYAICKVISLCSHQLRARKRRMRQCSKAEISQ